MLSVWRKLNIRTRLTLWYTLTLAGILAAFSCGTYLFLQHSLFESVDKQLHDDFELAIEILRIDKKGKINLTKRKQIDDNIFRHAKRMLEVWDRNTKTLLYPKSSHLGSIDESCFSARPGASSIRKQNGMYLRVRCTPFSLGLKHVVVRVARSEAAIRHELKELLLIFLLAVPIAILFSAFGGLFLARKALQPIEKITSQARRISAYNFSGRLELENKTDELGRLANEFNLVFDKLEKSFRQMKRFTSDASHELRTPLTALRIVGEVGLKTTPNDLKAVVSSMLEEAEKMSKLVESLLFLSRIDADQLELRKTAVDIGSLIADSLDPLRPKWEAKRVSIRCEVDESLQLWGDGVLLKQAIRNLVDNAIKFSPEGKRVDIFGEALDSSISLRVKDSGVGIPEEEALRIFERFYRLDKSRTRKTGGYGLGLSIAKWIVEAHGGSITVQSRLDSGSEFKVQLPRV